MCFKRMLQLFHLSVAKVDLDIGLPSDEERASVRAMSTLAGKLTVVLHRRTGKVTSTLAYAARSPMTCCPRRRS
jgi:predicted component of type VI protein secretion system